MSTLFSDGFVFDNTPPVAGNVTDGCAPDGDSDLQLFDEMVARWGGTAVRLCERCLCEPFECDDNGWCEGMISYNR